MNVLTDFIRRVVDLAVKIQQIPAPTYQEEKRARFVRQQFTGDGLSDVEIDKVGNVYGRIPASNPLKSTAPLVISAHLDTVFPIETDLSLKRKEGSLAGPGIADNSMGVACLSGLVWLLREREVDLNRDVWLVANTGEEGLGNLVGMKAVCERFKDRPKAYIILEGMELGDIFHRGLAIDRYRISAESAGGHSWTDFGMPSAVHEIAHLVTSISHLTLPVNPRTTLNVGVIHGGTSINTIAANASFELDLRSEQSASLRTLAAQVEDLAMRANRTGVRIRTEQIGQRPAGSIPANHWLVQLAARCLRDQGITPVLRIGSTDANIPLSLGLPAICLGVTTGGRAHSLSEYVNTDPLVQGIESIFQLICQET